MSKKGDLHFSCFLEDGVLGKKLFLLQKRSKLKFFIEFLPVQKGGFQESVWPKERLDRSWLSPCMGRGIRHVNHQCVSSQYYKHSLFRAQSYLPFPGQNKLTTDMMHGMLITNLTNNCARPYAPTTFQETLDIIESSHTSSCWNNMCS